MEKLLYIYLAINLYAFVICFVDKVKAIYKMWRISEKHLLLVSFAGGSVGMYLAMQIFRHKTRTPKFSIGVPVMIALHAVAGYYLMQRYNINPVELFREIPFIGDRV